MLRLHHDTAAIILPILPDICPLLMDLNLCTSLDVHTSVSTSSTAVCMFRNLRTLVVNTGLSNEAVMHLGRMENLRTFEAYWDSNTPSLVALPPLCLTSLPRRSLFPSLEKLSVTARKLSICAQLINVINLQVLESLTLFVVTSRFKEVINFFDLIRSEEHSLSSLRRISIRNLPQLPYVITWPQNITGTSLEPLLSLSRLIIVDLSLQCSFDLTDDDLLLMATSWPFLQSLYLGHVFGWRRISGITLDGLVPLTAHCFDLQNLGIVVDATVDPTLNTTGPVNDKITYLHLGDSITVPISKSWALNIARFFNQLFPKLTKIYVCGKDAAINDAWTMVETMVVLLGDPDRHVG